MKRLALTVLSVLFLIPPVSADDEGKEQPRKPERRGRMSFERILERFDANGDGKLTREEMKGRERFFDRIDADGDGTVTKEEFETFVKQRRGRRERKPPEGVEVIRDVEFAKVDGRALHVDLYVPKKPEAPKGGPKPGPKPKLLVWVHGGGWTKGSRKGVNPAFLKLTSSGYAVASVEYRLEGLDSHPKQIHDVKGAIRWLRANADKYGFDAKKIGVGGGSAGGHLAALLGTSAGVKDLEGTVGGNAKQSSRVQAVLDLYGPTELMTVFRHRGSGQEDEEFAKRRKSASPLTHLTKDDPPVLAIHGDQDKTVPLSHSRSLVKQYEKAGLKIELQVIEGAGHGGPQFSDEERFGRMKAFFDRHIRGVVTETEEEAPVPKPPDLPPEEEK